MPADWTLTRLNTAPVAELAPALHACCAAAAWVQRIVAARPYPDADALGRASDAATLALDAPGFAQTR